MSMDLKKGLAAAMAVCFAIGGSAISQTNSKLKLPEIKYETYTLPNGLKVITHEDHRLPLVAVDLWYHVGPLNERPGRTGFAHLFEHMMFEGSEHVGEKAHIKFVQGAGATDVNGTTDFDRTNYFETLPANQLELGLWLESDRMGFLMEGLNRDLLRNQRDVVRNERRQGEGRPYAAADEAVAHLLYPKGHPYYGDVIGSHADYAQQVGVLRGAAPLAVGAILQQVAPHSLITRIPNGDKQVLLAFKLPNDGKIYAVPVGYHQADGWTFIADQAFFYDDPHSLYSWNDKQWQAIESHTAIPGMTEQQVGLALGQVETSDSQTIGDRTVHYDTLGHPVDVVFVKGHATTVTPAKP